MPDDVLLIPVEADTTYQVTGTITYPSRPPTAEDFDRVLAPLHGFFEALAPAFVRFAEAVRPLLPQLRALAAHGEDEARRARLRRMHQQYRARRR